MGRVSQWADSGSGEMEALPRGPCLACPMVASLPPEVTLSSRRKMGTVMKRMMSRVWIMMMPSFSVFRRFS